MKPKASPRPPWFDDGRRDLWVRVGKFACLMNRSTMTVYRWYRDGTLKEFGYPSYRDLKGAIFIRIQDTNLPALKQICNTRHVPI